MIKLTMASLIATITMTCSGYLGCTIDQYDNMHSYVTEHEPELDFHVISVVNSETGKGESYFYTEKTK